MKKMIVWAILIALMLISPVAARFSWKWVNSSNLEFCHPNNVATTSMTFYRGRLYVGTVNDYGTQIWKRTRIYKFGYLYEGWKQVNGPGTNFRCPCNDASTSMAVYNDRLYVGTLNFEGAEIWRYDGTSWELSKRFGVQNREITSMAVYYNALYVGTWNDFGAQIWRFDGGSWKQDESIKEQPGFYNNSAITSMVAVGTYLFVGTKNLVTGTEIWAHNVDAASWDQINKDDFDEQYDKITSNPETTFLIEYNRKLYAISQPPAVSGQNSRSRMWRYTGRTNWELVNNLPNIEITSMTIFDGKLYVGTRNPFTGAEIWRYDGTSWEPDDDGFIDLSNTQATSMAVYSSWEYNRFFVGTYNDNGTRIYETKGFEPGPLEINFPERRGYLMPLPYYRFMRLRNIIDRVYPWLLYI